MIRKIITLGILALTISNCSDKNKKSEEEIKVIYEQEIIEEKTPEKEDLKKTIRNLEDLNAEQEENLKLSDTEIENKVILEEETKSEKEHLKNSIRDLETLNKNQEN